MALAPKSEKEMTVFSPCLNYFQVLNEECDQNWYKAESWEDGFIPKNPYRNETTSVSWALLDHPGSDTPAVSKIEIIGM